jgi:hypothetical protein
VTRREQELLRAIEALERQRFAGVHRGIAADDFDGANRRDARVRWLEGELYKLRDPTLQDDGEVDWTGNTT